MIESVHIIGCGTIGSNLTFKLCKLNVTEQLHIYDFDVVTYLDKSEFPYSKFHQGCDKVTALVSMMRCMLLGSRTQVVGHKKKVMSFTKKPRNIVIDCRDRKIPKIESHLRLALDGPTLIVDSRENYKTVRDHSEYELQKDFAYIDLATSIVVNLLVRDKYLDDSLRVFDLATLITKSTSIKETS